MLSQRLLTDILKYIQRILLSKMSSLPASFFEDVQRKLEIGHEK